MDGKLRVGILGGGGIVGAHAPGHRASQERAEVVAVAVGRNLSESSSTPAPWISEVNWPYWAINWPMSSSLILGYLDSSEWISSMYFMGQVGVGVLESSVQGDDERGARASTTDPTFFPAACHLVDTDMGSEANSLAPRVG